MGSLSKCCLGKLFSFGEMLHVVSFFSYVCLFFAFSHLKLFCLKRWYGFYDLFDEYFNTTVTIASHLPRLRNYLHRLLKLLCSVDPTKLPQVLHQKLRSAS